MGLEEAVLLSPDVEPIRYTVSLAPDLAAFTYQGTQSVTLNIVKATDTIEMHAKELSFWSCSYQPESGQAVECTTITLDIKATTVAFKFPSTLAAGNGTINLTFTGCLNNEMAGFYRSGYKDINGNDKIMGSTQFESLDARRAFPCWDEPSRKAVFSLTLTVPTSLTAFSNMPEAHCKTIAGTQGNMKEIAFMDTPIMSSYLLAWCVGEFDFVQSTTQHGVVVRVYTPPGKSQVGQFGLECACKTLDLFDDFFGIPYPLPKLDMIGIPDFAMGAMENWGLVTYREVDLLIDPIKASSQQKQRVCTVVTHELAHQWFGNLVTMAWWDDLWLNEGFASWAENYAADKLFPEWKMWEQYTVDSGAAALRLDALKSSHPIQVPIKHAEEVEEVFDAISYCKGSYVVRMIHAVLGHEAFQKGLQDYMQKHKYTNTTTDDLWSAWSKSSGLPVSEMMKSWTTQMGYPVLTVLESNFTDAKATIQVRQDWFLADGTVPSAADAKLWCVPVLSATAGGIHADISMMREDTITIDVDLAGGDWVKFNAGQSVPLRVAYDDEMIKRMTGAIESKAMGASDRAGVVLDCYALVKSGRVKCATLMKLLNAYTDEDDATVWEAIGGVLAGLNTLLVADESICADLQKVAKQIIAPLITKVGWAPSPEDGHLTILLRATMISLLSVFMYDDEGVAKEAQERFGAFLLDDADMQALPSDMRVAVFKIVLKNGGKKEYDEVKGYFATASDNAEKKHVLNALGATKDEKLKMDTLDWTCGGEVKLQDFFYTLGSVHRSGPVGMQMTWRYFQDNFEKMKGMVGKASASLMDAVIVFSCGGFASEEKANEIEEFFKKNPMPQNQRKIDQMLEAMRTNGQFLARLQVELGADRSWIVV